MILEFISFLESDTTLAALLGAGGSNTKFYPLVAPDSEETPFIIYAATNDGTSDDNLDDITISLRHCAKSYAEALALVDRVTLIADVQDFIAIASSYNKVFYSKKIGGSDSYEEDTRRYVLTRLYRVKFKRIPDSGSAVFYASLVAQRVNPGLYAAIVATNPSDYAFRYATDAEQLLFYTKNLAAGENGWTVVA